MAGDLERYDGDMTVGELEEFRDLPAEVRQAALEYARGLALAPQRDEPLPDGEDVHFVLVGVRQAGRAVLFASSTVTEAKFARTLDGIDRIPVRPGGPVARVPRYGIIVGAKMTSFEQHVGMDYADALATMLDEWRRRRRREQEQRRQLEQGGR